MNSGWIESEMDAIFSNYMRIYQLEMNRIFETLNLIWYLMDIIEDRPINEVKEAVVLDPFGIKEKPKML